MKFFQLKHILGNLSLVVISLGLGLFFAELLLRHFAAVDSGIEYRIPHPVFGWVLEPGGSYLNRMGEAKVRVAYNSKGFRDVEHTVENPHRVFRILVLGDSFMEAYSVELNQAFHKRVEQFAGDVGKEIETINLGVGGYGTLQEYLLFRELGVAYAPDLVLLSFYVANDLRNNSLELESLVYPGTIKVDSRPFLDPAHPTAWVITRVNFEDSRQRYMKAKEQRNTIIGKLANQSVLFHLIARMAGYRTIVLKKQNNSLGLYGVNYCLEPPEYSRAWDITRRILAKLKGDIEATGGKLVVFSTPALVDASASYMKEVSLKVENHHDICFEKAPGYNRLKEILNELQINYVDLLPEFRKAMNNGTNLFRRSDRHWNPEGHALAAQIVLSKLVEQKLLEPE